MLTKKFTALVLLLLLVLMPTGCASYNQSFNNEETLPTQQDGLNQSQAGPQQSPATEGTGELKVHFIDVGQGDAILVQSPSGGNMLVDAGDNDHGETVVDYLRVHNVNSLDIVIGTHPHADHIGGLDTVIDSFPVKSVYLPRVTHTSKSFEDVLEAIDNKDLKINTARAGVVLPLPGVQSSLIAPAAEKYEELNNYSAVIKITYGTKSFLLTGDAEDESEQQMINGGQNLQATVLKVGHHGSSSSTSYSFLQAVKPEYAVIMLGKDNSYGHPHKETLSRLSKAGIKILRTDKNGNIVISTDGEIIDVKTDR
ncbi:MAG: ComEC/Rec2 family competence protein [Syntrophomonadaceae bacterium]|jgi:competence protein ComEC